MERHRVPVTLSWQGPLPTRGLPEGVLYDVRLELRHAGGPEATAALARAFEALAGGARILRLPFMGARVRTRGTRWRLAARVGKDTASIRVAHRVKGGALARLVRGLTKLPGARDLSLAAEEEHYAPPFDSVGPCSPCAARAFGR